MLRYDPKVVREGKERFNPWWLIVECDEDLLRRLHRRAGRIFGCRLQLPLWGAHVSVVRGEAPSNRELWTARDGRQVELEYSDQIHRHRNSRGTRFFVTVRCSELDSVRTELGLARSLEGFHMTVGFLDSRPR